MQGEWIAEEAFGQRGQQVEDAVELDPRQGAIRVVIGPVTIRIEVRRRDYKTGLAAEGLQILDYQEGVMVLNALLQPGDLSLPGVGMAGGVVGPDAARVLELNRAEEDPSGVDGHDEEQDEQRQDDGHLDQSLAATIRTRGRKGEHPDDSSAIILTNRGATRLRTIGTSTLRATLRRIARSPARGRGFEAGNWAAVCGGPPLYLMSWMPTAALGSTAPDPGPTVPVVTKPTNMPLKQLVAPLPFSSQSDLLDPLT